MGMRDLATILTRLYGLLLLFYSFSNAQNAVIYGTIDAPWEATLRIGFFSSTAGAILNVVVGACLLVFAKNIAGWVAPKTPAGSNIVVSTADLGIVSFSLAGIVFFIDGFRWLLHDGIVWHFTSKPIGSTAPLDIRMAASLAMSAFKVVIGVVLMFGSKGLLRAFRWAQGEGGYKCEPKSGVGRQATIELLKIPKCPNCEAEYNPADYRQDLLEWFCPQCGKALPKE